MTQHSPRNYTQATTAFLKALTDDQTVLDQEIKALSDKWLNTLRSQFDEKSCISVSAYHQILCRGGKRIRGSLLMRAYSSFGGTSPKDAIQLACATEAIQASLLIIDNIQDRSTKRRQGDTAHIVLSQYHATRSMEGDSDHFGVSEAINGALAGIFWAIELSAQLEPPYISKVLSNMCTNLIATSIGQSLDIINAHSNEVERGDIEQAIRLKTALYTVSGPLVLGGILSGANAPSISTLAEIGDLIGSAYQQSDDILSTFSAADTSGKSSMDDIREGKKTLLIGKVMDMISGEDRTHLLHCLGNPNLGQEDFERCRRIIVSSGALEACQKSLNDICDEALQAINSSDLPVNLCAYLTGLVSYIMLRES